MLPEVMTAGQLARYLQLDEQTIYRKARSGQIPALHIGRIIRFKKEVIDDWIKLSSLQWTSKNRKELRKWAEDFAKSKGLKQKDFEKAVFKKDMADEKSCH